MNQTIKPQIRELCQETQTKWTKVLSLALLRIRIAPRTRENISPFEILHGRPYVLNLTGKDSQMHINRGQILKEYLISLGKVFNSLYRYIQVKAPVPLHLLAHPFKPETQYIYAHGKTNHSQKNGKDLSRCC